MSTSTSSQAPITAAVMIIGDEILSGRTKDANLAAIASFLGRLGIRLCEARVVADVEEEIVACVNALRARYTYVFTTGGIGPTHDDITADSMGAAFGVKVDYHPEALALLKAHYAQGELNEARMRMARTPQGAVLIDNPVSKAPGFQIENVFVMAGIPALVEIMLESLRPRLTGGPAIQSRSVKAFISEGAIAEELGGIARAHADVQIGSYPFFRNNRYGTSLVARGVDAVRLETVACDIRDLVRRLGGEILSDEDA